MTEVTITGNDITVAIGTPGGGTSGVTEEQLATKVDKVAGKGLSTEDYTTAEKSKLSGVEPGATADQTGAEIKTAYENEADTNAFNDADKAKVDNLPADIGVYIDEPLGAFNPLAMDFTQSGIHDNYPQAGNIIFTKTGTLVNSVEKAVRITSNGTNTFNFSSDFEKGAIYGLSYNATNDNYGTLPAGAWWFYFKVFGTKIHVSVPGVSPIDVTAPTLSNFTVATATPFRVGFSSSEVITGTTFAGFTIPGHTITARFINAGQTTGHYFTVAERFVEGEAARTVAYDGTDGWKDIDNNALAAFGPVAITNSVTAPAISSVVVAGDNSTVTVNLSVGGYANDNGTGDLLVADFTAALSGGVATSPVLSNPVHTAGGTAVVFDLSYTGEADGNETLTITVASGASVFDQYGNAMQAGESGADGLNADAPAYSFVNTHELVVDAAGEGVNVTNPDCYPSDGAGNDEAFSIELWYETPGALGTARNPYIVRDDGGAALFFLRRIALTDKFDFRIQTDASNHITRGCDTTTLSINTLYHVVVTYDGSETVAGIKIYINGTEEAAYIDTSAGSYTGVPALVGNVVLAIANAPGTSAEGNYQLARQFNAELSGAEVTTLYNSGTPVGLNASLQAKCVQENLLNNTPNADNIGVNGTNQGTVTYAAL